MKFLDSHKSQISEALQRAGCSHQRAGCILDVIEAILNKGQEIDQTINDVLDQISPPCPPPPTPTPSV
jgi:hypothetical protein